MIRLGLFTDSWMCKEEKACTSCRGQYAFRESLTRNYELPDNEINFKCPLGKPLVGINPVENGNVSDVAVHRAGYYNWNDAKKELEFVPPTGQELPEPTMEPELLPPSTLIFGEGGKFLPNTKFSNFTLNTSGKPEIKPPEKPIFKKVKDKASIKEDREKGLRNRCGCGRA